jgi:hypothetical protein
MKERQGIMALLLCPRKEMINMQYPDFSALTVKEYRCRTMVIL